MNLPEIFYIVDGELHSDINPPDGIRLTAGISFTDIITKRKYKVLMVEASDEVARVILTEI